MISKKLLDRLEAILGELNLSVNVLDRYGNSLIPETDIRFSLPSDMRPGEPVLWEGRWYQACSTQHELILTTPFPDALQVKDTFYLCDRLIGLTLATGSETDDIRGAYQRLLENDLPRNEADSLLEEYRIPEAMHCRVMLLFFSQLKRGGDFGTLQSLIPLGNNDVLLQMDKHSLVLIKDTRGMNDLEEIREYAQALRETLLSETGMQVSIGLGNSLRSSRELHSGYRQARRAIDIGRAFSEDEDVFVYGAMLLERFLSDLGPETAAHYHKLLFNRETSRLFTDEMLKTIDMFFKKDLNLSDTARQLYIHRNTLVYRLDKIQRTVGLDLRKFEEAVTFKLFYEMRHCADSFSRDRL